MIQALLFDMDGVLLDTEVLSYEIWRDYLKRTQNYDMPREQYALISGSPPNEFDRFIQLHLPGDTAALLRNWEEEMQHRIEQMNIPTMPGYEALVPYLNNFPGKKAIVTSNGAGWLKGYTELFHFREIFDCIFSADVALPRKPSPEPYLRVCQLLGVVPEKCLAIEDSQSGITAALEARIPVIQMLGISRVSPDIEGRCVAQVRDLNELVEKLQTQISIEAQQNDRKNMEVVK